MGDPQSKRPYYHCHPSLAGVVHLKRKLGGSYVCTSLGEAVPRPSLHFAILGRMQISQSSISRLYYSPPLPPPCHWTSLELESLNLSPTKFQLIKISISAVTSFPGTFPVDQPCSATGQFWRPGDPSRYPVLFIWEFGFVI